MEMYIERYRVEPLIKDTLNKGHNTNNLRTKDKFQCTKWRLSYILLTSNKGQPLSKRKNGQKTNVSVIQRFHCSYIAIHVYLSKC